MKYIIDNVIELLTSEYGYPLSNLLTINYKEMDNYTIVNILTSNSNVFVVGIVYKNTINIDEMSILKKEFDDQASCMLGFIYKNSTLIGYKYKSKDSELIKLREFETYKSSEKTVKSQMLGKTKNSTNLISIPENLEVLFFNAHSHIRDIDGLHADEALDELCKIIYTKLFDEESISKNNLYQFQKNLYGNESELTTSIYELYREANEYDKRVYSLRIPGYKRSRGVFDQKMKLSTSALSKVIEEFQEYDFSSTSFDIKGRAFQNVFLPALRAGMGQYFTPAPIIKLIVESAKPNARDLILDPFCGSGHFLTESLDYVRKKEQKEKVIDEFAYHKLHGIEKSERMVRIAMTDMRLHGDGHANIRCTDALLPFENYHDIEENSFDYVFTNPPFGSLLGAESIKSLGDFELSKNKNKIPLEILGLERSIQFLKQDGKLAIVLPDSILVNASTLYVREWLNNCITINAIVSLPIETFSPYGANVKTSILFLTKRISVDTNKVFCSVIENIGYDASGRTTTLNDIKPMITKLSKHLESEGW